MSSLYNINAPKKPANLSVNSDLLEQAKELKINISSTLEQALAETVREKKKESWLKENREAIEAYNKTVHEYGLFSDELRTF